MLTRFIMAYHLVIVILLGWLARVIYSLYFSQLKQVPSPLIFQLFPIYYKYLLARGTSPYVIHQYYEKYGPVFRVGWNTVLFVDMQAAHDIYGTHQFSKGTLYSGFNYFGENIVSLRDRELHMKRKKLLSPAFTKSSLASIEPRIIEAGIKGLFQELNLASDCNIKVNLYNLIRFTLWDITTDISFGTSLGMLQGINRQVIDWVAWALKYGIVCSIIPALSRFKPKVMKQLHALQETLLQRYLTHRNTTQLVGVRNLDRFFDQMGDGGLTYEEVYAEAHMMLISGTDTTTNSIASTIYLVLKHHQIYQKLMLELNSINLEGEFFTYSECKNLIYLDAAIHEALRLLPVASIPLIRETPRHGRMINGYFIPEKTEVGVPIYSLHHSNELWDHPNLYLPERWIKDEALNPILINHSNFIPFSLGPRGCFGKELAWMEMKVLIANLFRTFEFNLMDPEMEIEYAACPAFQPKNSEIWVWVRRSSK